MIYILLAIASIAGFMGIIVGYNRLIAKREEQIAKLHKRAYKGAFDKDETPSEQPEIPDVPHELSYSANPEFNTKDAPGIKNGRHNFIDIINAYGEWFDNFADKKGREDTAKWLIPAIKQLGGQCDSIAFAVTDIQHLLNLLKDKEFVAVTHVSFVETQKVLNTFDDNRAEALDLIEQIYSTENGRLLKKLEKTLLCLIRDNEEIIDGLDTFRNSLHQVLAQACEDSHPDHITDFTSLHKLLEIPVMVDRVMTQLKEEEEQDQVEVPTIEMPKGKRTMDYFSHLGLDEKPSETKPEEHDTGGIFYGECGVD